MPVKHILASSGVPLIVHFAPKPVNVGGKGLFIFVAVLEIFAGYNEALHKEGAFYEVAAVVFLPERLGFSGGAVNPVTPHSVITVGFGEEIHYFLEAFHPLLAGNEATVDAGDKSGNAETGAAGGNYITVVLRIYTVEMDAFGSKTGIRLRTLPHIVEMGLLYIVEQFVIRSKRFRTSGRYRRRILSIVRNITFRGAG